MSSNPNEYHLVTFDPGGTIGWAHIVVSCRAFSRPEHKVLRFLKSWDCGEFSGTERQQLQQASRLMYRARFDPPPYLTTTDVISNLHPMTEIISEDFELTQMVGGKNLLSPVRCNAVLEWECAKLGIELQLQKRTMRTSSTEERLELFGFHANEAPSYPGRKWTKTGKGKDGFAAMQHAVVWLRRVKDASRSRPWKMSDRQTHNAFWDCECRKGNRCDLNHPGARRYTGLRA